jgi:hypothetical protein
LLAQRIDLSGVIDARLHRARDGVNSGAKALSVIGAMLAPGDSIGDVGVLRAGAAASLFNGTRASSTVGRGCGRTSGPTSGSSTWSAARCSPACGRPGPARMTLTIALDSTGVEGHGGGKQGAASGYTEVPASPAAVDVCADRAGADEPVAWRVRRSGSRGGVVPERDDQPGAQRRRTGQLTVRIDSATGVSGADTAETVFTVFCGDDRDARQVCLVVRRVRPTPGRGWRCKPLSRQFS